MVTSASPTVTLFGVANEAPPSSSSTLLPTTALEPPIATRNEVLVAASLALRYESVSFEEPDSVGTPGAAGAAVSLVNANSAPTVPTLPATSVTLAVSDLSPSAPRSRLDTVKLA